MFQFTPGDFQKARDILAEIEDQYAELSESQRVLLDAQFGAALRFLERCRDALRRN